MWAGSFQNWNICPETWWRWLPPCFRLPWDWGLQKGMGTLLRLELQHPSPSPQRQEHLSALNHPPFHSQHTAPLCFIHIGSTLQWHPFTVNMLNTSYSVPSPWFKLFPRFLLRFGRPNPLLSLHLITWWLSYIWASLKHLLPVNYLLCELHGVQNPDHIVHAAGCMVEKRVGWTEPRVKLHHPPSLQPSLPPCSHAVRHGQWEGCPSPQDLHSAGRRMFWLGTIRVCNNEEWGRKRPLWHCSHLENRAQAKPMFSHAPLLFSRDILQRKQAGWAENSPDMLSHLYFPSAWISDSAFLL